MRILQVGVGRWGRNHLRCWQRMGVELWVCDHHPAVLDGLDLPSVRDHRELLDSVDAVDVVTSGPSHGRIVRDALDQGKDVFVEKPLTPGSAEAFELHVLARAQGAVLQVGHVFRFAPEIRAVAEALGQGRIGCVRYVASHFNAFKRPRSDGGAALSDAIHFVDLTSWLLGKQPVAVGALAPDLLGRGLDDVALLTLDYGAELARVEAGHVFPEARRDLVVVGSEGSLVCDFLASTDRVRLLQQEHCQDGAGHWQAIAGAETVLPLVEEEPLLAELSAFVDSCRSRRGSAIAADGFAGAAAVAVIEAAQRAARERRSVELKLPAPTSGAPA